MLTVRDIMSTDVVAISPEFRLRDAFDLLASRHLSGVPVVVGPRVVGVLSATDLLGFTAALPAVPAERPEAQELEEWQTPEEWEEGTEPPGAFFHELWADVGADVLERFASPGAPEWDVLGEHTVGEAMTRQPLCTVAPDASVAQAARRLLSAGVHRLLVMEDGELVGLVTTSDIVRAVAEAKLTGVGPGARGPHAARR